MSTHSVADAKNHLSELIDRTLNGEEVIVTRHGRPVVEFRPVPAPSRPVTQAYLGWRAARRMRREGAVGEFLEESIVRLVQRMRDEDEL
jgi:antitoxin (DNA-binding transcriptional repressor) of toxin-antitoxin stability system